MHNIVILLNLSHGFRNMDDSDSHKKYKLANSKYFLEEMKLGLEWKLKLSYKIYCSIESLTEVYHE